MPPARLVRKRPLMERIKASLNVMDLLLWLSEEIETRDWDSNVVGTQLGLAFNFAFLIARANSGRKSTADDVFGDETDSGWVVFLVGSIVWFLVGFATLNAFYTMNRTRKYRMFEADVEKEQNTPSAHRVRVQSSPVASSPLRFLSHVINPESAESRAHPDRTRDVWELAVWDPLPICLRLFSLFSPGHVLVYWIFLPLEPLDPRPSVTVVKCLFLQVILSGQMWLLQSRFSQQNKDTSIIQKEVMREYDTKFVHPRLYPTVRDASTQLSQDDIGNEQEAVEVGTPSTVLRRGFRTNPNPNYAKHFNPDGDVTPARPSTRGIQGQRLFTPRAAPTQSDAFASSVSSRPSAMRRSTPGFPTPVNPTPSRAVSTTSTTQTQTQTQGNGGYLGIHTHPSSPLKKAPSLGDLGFRSPRNNSEMAKLEQFQAYQARDRSSSPLKPARNSAGNASSLNQAASNPWARQPQKSYERYPSMFNNY
ncbi:hypothetical protein PG993_003395 [Apiospora rasikravindrae]|uniref:Meiotically up-regulated gene 154 protein n=1 Tax=Apiospora rasikravindrae TaxID=990691 RepID=A0ABR1U1P8_9PEZI